MFYSVVANQRQPNPNIVLHMIFYGVGADRGQLLCICFKVGGVHYEGPLLAVGRRLSRERVTPVSLLRGVKRPCCFNF